MRADRFGEFLSRIIPLTGHDIEEILQEQRVTSRPFGDIALSLGLCEPEDIWHAWSDQLIAEDGSPRFVNLEEIGIDTQAIGFVPMEDARLWTAIPVRVFGDELVVAIDREMDPALRAQMQVRHGMRVKFVLADRLQIKRAIEVYYGLPAAA